MNGNQEGGGRKILQHRSSSSSKNGHHQHHANQRNLKNTVVDKILICAVGCSGVGRGNEQRRLGFLRSEAVQTGSNGGDGYLGLSR